MESPTSSEVSRTGVILFAHGSAVEEANRGVRELARRVEDGGPYPYVRAAFLGPGKPELGPAIREAAEAGMEEIVVIPFFLTMGIHLRRDLPKLVAAEKQKHPRLVFRVGRSLEDHPGMTSLILSRIQEATEGSKVIP